MSLQSARLPTLLDKHEEQAENLREELEKEDEEEKKVIKKKSKKK